MKHLLEIITEKGYKPYRYNGKNYILDNNPNNFSSVIVGGTAVFYVKDDDFENPIIWGLQEMGKPPTLIKPRFNVSLKRTNPTNRCVEIINGMYNDAIDYVLKNNCHLFLFDNLYNKKLYFEFDLTKNPTNYDRVL